MSFTVLFSSQVISMTHYLLGVIVIFSKSFNENTMYITANFIDLEINLMDLKAKL